MKKNNKTLLWVCPEFKVKLKTEAAKNNSTVLDYTKELAFIDDPLIEVYKNEKKNKKQPFPFSF